MERHRRRPIDILTPDEVQVLIATASNRAPSGIRNRALIAVLYFSGIRLAEALALLPRDIDLDAGEINVRCGKGGRQRLVGINAQAQAHLSRWMDPRVRLAINGRQPVFCTFSKANGKPRVKTLSPRYVQHMLHRLAGKSPLEKRIHPHSLRHYAESRIMPSRTLQGPGIRRRNAISCRSARHNPTTRHQRNRHAIASRRAEDRGSFIC